MTALHETITTAYIQGDELVLEEFRERDPDVVAFVREAEDAARQQLPVEGISRITHRDTSHTGHGRILRGRCGRAGRRQLQCEMRRYPPDHRPVEWAIGNDCPHKSLWPRDEHVTERERLGKQAPLRADEAQGSMEGEIVTAVSANRRPDDVDLPTDTVREPGAIAATDDKRCARMKEAPRAPAFHLAVVRLRVNDPDS